jgi:hypothetical protein
VLAARMNGRSFCCVPPRELHRTHRVTVAAELARPRGVLGERPQRRCECDPQS